MHDTARGELPPDGLTGAHPGVPGIRTDGGYRSGAFDHGAGPGADVEVVRRPLTGGLGPLPKRWVTGRAFGRLTQHRRLARDREALPRRPRVMIRWTVAGETFRELTGEFTPTRRTEMDMPASAA